jgi:hypothetical protein
LLCIKDLTISDLLSEIRRRLPYLSSYKIFKKYLVCLADYDLISYNGQRHAYHIEENGFGLLSYIDKEKKESKVSRQEEMMITIEREGGF